MKKININHKGVCSFGNFAPLLIALLFLFVIVSCSSDASNDDGGTDNGISSSSEISSSSSIYVEEYCNNIEYGTNSFTCGGQTYKTIVIEKNTWMAENLNYKTEKSTWCKDDEPINCEKYGRLYSWATAMNLPFSCTGSNCASQINTPHQGICPDGWHIPSVEEWFDLFTLLVTGMAYLPASANNNDISWWSATESGNNIAYLWFTSGSSLQGTSGGLKRDAHSIRCIKDRHEVQPLM